jgi:hypothetical protein
MDRRAIRATIRKAVNERRRIADRARKAIRDRAVDALDNLYRASWEERWPLIQFEAQRHPHCRWPEEPYGPFYSQRQIRDHRRKQKEKRRAAAQKARRMKQYYAQKRRDDAEHKKRMAALREEERRILEVRNGLTEGWRALIDDETTPHDVRLYLRVYLKTPELLPTKYARLLAQRRIADHGRA